jgi:hypothetical protein
MMTHSPSLSPVKRQDKNALWLGVLFSLVFTALIWFTGRWLADVPHLPQRDAWWYFWKLPQATFWSQATSWGFYLLHQLTLWGLIYYAQTRVGKYSTHLQPVNIAALGANVFFIALHLLQTQVWYDGLAQEMPVWSSQASVIVLLVWVLLMENPRRGLFFGKKVPIRQEVTHFARKYHGYFFAWASVYTFWFHPMENTPGHLIGFFYMFLLLLQGSLFFTRIHVNRWWTLTQEIVVLFHGTLVAVMQGSGMWPMFAFGFAGIFVITQMHGLGLSRLARGSILGLFVAATLGTYAALGWARLNEVVRIPLIEYAGVFALTGIFWLGLKLAGKLNSKNEGIQEFTLPGQREVEKSDIV